MDKEQLELKVEETEKYQSLKRQLEGTQILYKSAMESSRKYEDRVKSRETDLEDLKKQNELLTKKYKEMQALPIFAGNPENPLPDPTVDELKAKIERLTAERAAAEKRADRGKSDYYLLIDFWQETIEKNQKLSANCDELKAELEETRKELQQAQEKLLELHVEPHNARGAGRKPKLNDEQRNQAKTLSEQGLSLRKISKLIGVSPATILRCLRD